LRYKRLTRYSMSLVVIYFGTNRLYRDTPLAHHNIILSAHYRELITQIFEGRSLPKEFSLYLHTPTLTDPSVAPEGHEAFYVLSPVPHLGAPIDWVREAKALPRRHYGVSGTALPARPASAHRDRTHD
jgi:phytoene desaturase